MISFFLGSVSLLYYIASSTADMRQEPTENSEIVSQGYFSEQVNLIENHEDWVKIETIIDHYQGWVKKASLHERETSFLSNPLSIWAKVNRCAAHIYDRQDTIYGPILTLPYDSKLEVLEPNQESKSRWIKVLLVDGRIGYIQRGDVSIHPISLDRYQMCALSLHFLGLPYTWGGRSSFGYDCSGFVQMLYRQMGIYLPRDAKDQINWIGFTPIAITHLSPGDLIFFGLAEDQIRHVGLYLGSNQFIHATTAENSPYIRISSLFDSEWNGSSRMAYITARSVKTKNNQ